MSKCSKHHSTCDNLFNPEWCESNENCFANFYYPFTCDTLNNGIVLNSITSSTSTCQLIPLLQVQPTVGECRKPSNKWDLVPIMSSGIRAFGIKIPYGCGGCYLIDLIVNTTSI